MELEELYRALERADAAAQGGDEQAAADAREIAQMIRMTEAAQQQSARPEPTDTGVAEDVAKSFGSGVMRGVGYMFDMPGQLGGLIGQGIERLTGTDVGMGRPQQPFMEAVGEVAPRVEQAASYEAQTTPGRYAGVVGEFAPGALLPFDELSYFSRFMRGAALPGVASELAGSTTEALGGSEAAQNRARIIAALGAPMALGAAESGARAALTSGARAYEPGSERLAAVQTLDEFGVDGLSAGARLGSERVLRLEGAEDTARNVVGGINQAVMRLLGSDAPRPTRQALGAVEDRLGQVFDEAGSVSAIPPREALDQLDTSFYEYMDLQTQQGATIPKTVENIISDVNDAATNGRAITGRQVQEWRGRLRRLAETSERSNRGDIADLARGVSSALDDIVVSGARSRLGEPELYTRLLEARNQYRDLRTVASALNRGGSEARSGLLSPEALSTAVRRTEGEQAVVRRPSRGPLRPLSELALAGEEVASSLPAVTSGGRRVMDTGPLMQGLGTGALSASAATMFGQSPSTAATLATMGMLAPLAAGPLTRSPYVQQMLLRDPTLRGAAAQQLGLLGQVAPGATQQVQR